MLWKLGIMLGSYPACLRFIESGWLATSASAPGRCPYLMLVLKNRQDAKGVDVSEHSAFCWPRHCAVVDGSQVQRQLEDVASCRVDASAVRVPEDWFSPSSSGIFTYTGRFFWNMGTDFSMILVNG